MDGVPTGGLEPDNDPTIDFAYRSGRPRFIGAFVTAASRLRSAGWLSRRLLVVTVVVVIALMAGFAVGAIPVLLRKNATATAQPTAPGNVAAAAPAARQFTAVTGYGCAQSPSAAFSEYGWYMQGLNGFVLVSHGGLRADGCGGTFPAMPMSGSSSQDDPQNYAIWAFRTHPVVRGACDVSVFVPADSNIRHVGGDPAYYQVLSGAGHATPLGAFTIQQHSHLGTWVTEGPYHITTSSLSVKLHSRGIDWSGTISTRAHIAVSPVRVTCNAA